MSIDIRSSHFIFQFLYTRATTGFYKLRPVRKISSGVDILYDEGSVGACRHGVDFRRVGGFGSPRWRWKTPVSDFLRWLPQSSVTCAPPLEDGRSHNMQSSLVSRELLSLIDKPKPIKLVFHDLSRFRARRKRVHDFSRRQVFGYVKGGIAAIQSTSTR